MRHLPPLTAVRVFEAAARHLNFTSAASELGMTQAAVSYQIKLLEERLGFALFRREKKRVLLTEAGLKAAPIVSGAFDMLDDAFAAARADHETVLTISSTQTFVSNWIAPRLGGFQVTHPEFAVRVETSNQFVDFARDHVDVAIRSGLGPWPGLATHFLFRQHFTPMCGAGFLARHPELKTPADLLRTTLISPEYRWWNDWMTAASVESAGVARRPGVVLDSQANDGNAAMADQGVALLTPCFWSREIAAGRLIPLFPRKIAFDGTSYWLVYPERRGGLAKIRRLREWLLSEMIALAAEDKTGAFNN